MVTTMTKQHDALNQARFAAAQAHRAAKEVARAYGADDGNAAAAITAAAKSLDGAVEDLEWRAG